MARRLWFCAAALILAFLALGPPLDGAEKTKPPKKPSAAEKKDAEKQKDQPKFVLKGPLVVQLEESARFDMEEPGVMRYPAGQYVRCTAEPSKEVKAYPKLKSKRPLYGCLSVDGSYYDAGQGKKLYFVLDESGTEQKPAKPKKEAKPGDAQNPSAKAEKAADKKTAEKNLAAALAEVQARASRPRPAPLAYDRLYFDLNGDGDLTNDGVIVPAKKSPFGNLPVAEAGVVFEDLALAIDVGPPTGKRPFPVVAWLQGVSPGSAYLMFVPKQVRKGTVRLGNDEYTVVLSQSRLISGRYDRPFVQVELAAKDRSSGKTPPVSSGLLGTMRRVGGELVTLSATPEGDRLTIEPYRGDYGLLEVGSGGRAVTKLGAAGEFTTRTGSVPADDRRLMLGDDLPRQIKLPVGDYRPVYLNVLHGQVRFTCRYFSDPRDGTAGRPITPPTYGIKIRKDKPFVLEFAGKPDVVFLSPTEKQTVKPGENVRIACMLAERGQGILITGLWDMKKKTGEISYRDGDKEIKVPEYTRLDPEIVIRNSVGEEVSKGKMPFG